MGSYDKNHVTEWKQQNRIEAFKASFSGIKILVREEVNFKIHLMITVLVVILGFVFEISIVEWFVVLLLIGQVLALEAINSAIEAVVDMVAGTKWHPLAKKSKDIAAAAVVIDAMIAVIIGCIIFMPHIISLFSER